MAAALWIAWRLAQPILLIIAGIVFAALLDGGTRLLGRVLPIGRAWRLLIVGLAALSAIVGTGYWMGVEIVQQAGELRETVTAQVQRLMSWLSANRSEEHTSELQSLMRISYAVFCLTKK